MHSQLFISIARMHHISNPSKFRRLRRHALQSEVSGLVKTGKPGVLVLDGKKAKIKTFLERARELRYLDFHHVDMQPLPMDMMIRLADGKFGLQEVTNMSELIKALDRISLKEWFRNQMGMAKSP
ncbi:hypothetical protein BDQ12DRAFT_488607 [Crucibulum laeve]|uniref:Uncharacterized protein n=1 Tax=Crucibulum laeve TaxID=68775 RepID=A0A5C3M4L6_9AGAR|nr:hypothetical protein BDQ12DRAFT_488607 [Crucibulum laeve]